MKPVNDPVQTYDRLKAAWDDAVKTLRHRRPWVYIGLGAIAMLFVLAANNKLGQTAQEIVFGIGRAVWAGLKLPLWAGGIVVVTVVVTVLATSWWETRPGLRQQITGLETKLRDSNALVETLRPNSPPDPEPLGVQEINSIQHIRTFWMEYGRAAPIMLQQMLVSAVEYLQRSELLVELVDRQTLWAR